VYFYSCEYRPTTTIITFGGFANIKQVDAIVTWLLTDENTHFIEVLPEASCKMGLGLKSPLITRAAFAILVSEEALSLAARGKGKFDADKQRKNQFGRHREDISEDLRTSVEYASKSFADRIIGVMGELVDKKMTWFEALPEFQKLTRFENALSSCKNESLRNFWLGNTEDLKSKLRHFVRCCIYTVLFGPIAPGRVEMYNTHRQAEEYMPVEPENTIQFDQVYNGLGFEERVLTQPFWTELNFQAWHLKHDYCTTYQNVPNAAGFRHHGVEAVDLKELVASRELVNLSILTAMQHGYYASGVIPPEAYGVPSYFDNKSSYYDNENEKEPAEGHYASSRASAPQDDFYVGNEEKQGDKAIPRGFNADLGGIGDQDWNGSNADSSLNFIWESNNPFGANRGRAVKFSAGPDQVDFFPSNPYVSKVNDFVPANSGIDTLRLGGNHVDLPSRPKPMEGSEKLMSSDGLESGKESIHSNDKAPILPQDLGDNNAGQTPAWIEYHEAPLKYGRPASSTLNSPRHLRNLRALLRTESPTMTNLPEIPSTLQVPSSVPRLKGKHRETSDTDLRVDVPPQRFITENSDFFSQQNFFSEVSAHIKSLSTEMLSTHEIGFPIKITDTILCLGPQEFKYLPLWAGGDDDGTGGVFEAEIPYADAGPNGPGPSFHTGFSNTSSRNSEWDEEIMSRVTSINNTSVGVEDGHSSTFDRRRVISDDGFSEDSEMYDVQDKGKGKEVDNVGMVATAAAKLAGGIQGYSTMSSASSVSGSEAAMTDDDDQVMSFYGDSDAGTETGFDFVTPAASDMGAETESGGAKATTTSQKITAGDTEEDNDDDWDGADGNLSDFGGGDSEDEDMEMV
jgi:hypothetical protein